MPQQLVRWWYSPGGKEAHNIGGWRVGWVLKVDKTWLYLQEAGTGEKLKYRRAFVKVKAHKDSEEAGEYVLPEIGWEWKQEKGDGEADGLRDKRRSMCWSQKRMADHLGITQAMVSKMENGVRPIPESLRVQLEALRAPVSDLRSAPAN